MKFNDQVIPVARFGGHTGISKFRLLVFVDSGIAQNASRNDNFPGFRSNTTYLILARISAQQNRFYRQMQVAPKRRQF